MTDWRAWYAQYDDPSSSLSRRLNVVRRRVRDALAARPVEAQWRILSLCSGDGRDLLPEMAGSDHTALSALLVEQDSTLADDAATTALRLGLGRVSVVVGDAGETATFAHDVPADLILLCGIFGNISEDDIATTIKATPAMLNAGATGSGPEAAPIPICDLASADGSSRPASPKSASTARLTVSASAWHGPPPPCVPVRNSLTVCSPSPTD